MPGQESQVLFCAWDIRLPTSPASTGEPYKVPLTGLTERGGGGRETPASLAAFVKTVLLWREEFSELLPSRSSPNLCWCMGLFVHWCRTLHLCLLNFRILCSSHFSSLSGSFWMAAQHSGWTVHRHSQSCSAYLKFKRFPKLGLLPVNWWSCLEIKSRWINRFF